jgi:hypothetical protein
MNTLLKALGILFILMVGGCGAIMFAGLAAGGKAAHDIQQQQEANTITLAQFNQIQNGMSYAQVVQIVGRQGTVISENTMAGFHTIMYQWEAGFMANMNTMFQNDKLMQKSQFGMK